MFFLGGCDESKQYSQDMFYMDTYINVKLYSNDKKLINQAFNKIDSMYKEYDELSDRYRSHVGIMNINYINNKLLVNEEIQIDKRLYDILKYSKSYESKTNGLFNIALGNIIDVWKDYRDGIKEGVPTIDELKNSGSINSDALVLLPDNKIKKTENISLDLGAISKGYVTELVGDYLDSIGLHKYLITAGTSSVKAGNHYSNSCYKIGLTDPNNADDLYKIITGNNISITTSGSFERFYEYNGVRYSHIINPHTLFSNNYMQSVTVITDDSALGEILSTTLFLMPIKDGLEYIKNFDGVEAVWYGMDNKVTLSDGMSKYE
jgi:thiamine biosynthesis lipoprotein